MNKTKKVIRRLYTSNVVILPSSSDRIRLCRGGIHGGMVIDLPMSHTVKSAKKEWHKLVQAHPYHMWFYSPRHKNRKPWRLHGTKKPLEDVARKVTGYKVDAPADFVTSGYTKVILPLNIGIYMTKTDIAQAAHEINKSYCHSIGDDSQPT